MEVRSLGWQDLIALYRYRSQVLPLDQSILLTRGNPAGPSAWLSLLRPDRGSYTAITDGGDPSSDLIGQVVYRSGDRAANFAFLSPEPAIRLQSLCSLMENLYARAAEMGALSVIAELKEDHPAFDDFRRAGFSVYGWEQIWQLKGSAKALRDVPPLWKQCTSVDENAVRSLYQSLVPPLAQSAENAFPNRRPGLVYREGETLLGYVEGIFGVQGIYLQPILHPDVIDPRGLILDLLNTFSALGRPVYLAVRSYQSWLEAALEELECVAFPRQALFVHHLVREVRSPVLVRAHSVLKNQQAEPTTWMVDHFDHSNGQHGSSTP